MGEGFYPQVSNISYSLQIIYFTGPSKRFLTLTGGLRWGKKEKGQYPRFPIWGPTESLEKGQKGSFNFRLGPKGGTKHWVGQEIVGEGRQGGGKRKGSQGKGSLGIPGNLVPIGLTKRSGIGFRSTLKFLLEPTGVYSRRPGIGGRKTGLGIEGVSAPHIGIFSERITYFFPQWGYTGGSQGPLLLTLLGGRNTQRALLGYSHFSYPHSWGRDF